MSKKIYINPGHSDKDPGAVGYEKERDLNVKVSAYQRDYLLENYDCQVKMNPGTLGNLAQIAGEANTWGADLFVSNHFNAGGGDGWEGLVYGSARVPLGQAFEKHVKAAGQNSRGVKLRPDLAVLRLTQMPAVLNEGAFVDNQKDIADWNEDHELQKLGIAYAKAAAEFLGLDAKTEAPVETSFALSLRVLRNGDTGEAVRALQILLNGSGYSCGTADGIFGSKTENAVRKYQDANKLPVTGIADAATMGSLMGLE